MPTSDESRDEHIQKKVQFYAAGVQAWYNTALEHDKSLLVLAAGGIGLLITLLTTVGLSSELQFVLYVAAIVSFGVCLTAVLVIFGRNKKHIERVLSDQPREKLADPLLDRLDLTALTSFGFGAAFAALIGISAAYHSVVERETSMTKEKDKSPLRESFSGASNLQPGRESLKRSFSGVGNLKPEATAPTPAPAPAPSGPTEAPKESGS